MIGRFYADLLIDGVVLIEIKAAASVEPYAVAQLLNYLKAAGGGIGLLLNFGRQPEVKRLVLGVPPAPFEGGEQVAIAAKTTSSWSVPSVFIRAGHDRPGPCSCI